MESVLGLLLDDGEVVAAPVAAGIIVTESAGDLVWRGNLYLPSFHSARPGESYTFRANDGRCGQVVLSSPIPTRSGALRVGFTGDGPWVRFSAQATCDAT
jgi:hypothetical protein